MGWFGDSSKRIDEHEKALRAINAKAEVPEGTWLLMAWEDRYKKK